MKLLIILSFLVSFFSIPVYADSPVKIKNVYATTEQSTASDTYDIDNSSGWNPEKPAEITYQFGADLYLTSITINCSGASSKAIFKTTDNVRRDITLTQGTKKIKLPSILTKSFSIELVSTATNFKINEISFSQGEPLIPVRSAMTARASSILQNKRKKYGPQLAIDGKLSTSWNEGVKNEKGQWLDVKLKKPSFVHHVGYIIGYSKYNQKVGEVWFKNYRIKTAKIDYGNGWYYNAVFEDKLDYQYVPVRMLVRNVRFTISDLYDTLKWKDAPISEVKFIYEYIDDIKLEASFDQDNILKNDKAPRSFVVRVKGAYTPQKKRLPVNLALVVDQSGSMSEQNRMLHAREAAKLIVSSLGPDDYLSLITFATNVFIKQAPVLMTSNNKNKVIKQIDNLRTADMTNFYGALEKSIKLTKENLSDKYSNRVLMLSDGKPTKGIKNPNQIAQLAKKGYNSDIITTTFGVGASYNEDLMTDIAVKSNGSYYHITNPSQMFKVFVSELSSILKVVGKNASVKIELPKNLSLSKVYGYNYSKSGQTLTIPLKPISSGGEQKIVLELKPNSKYPVETQINVSLNYEDALNGGEKITTNVSRILERTDNAKTAKLSRNSVVIAETLSTQSSQGLEDAAKIYQSGSTSKARNMLQLHIKNLEKENRYLQSKALVREIAILKRILNEMQSNSYSSSSGKLAIKEAKAAAFHGRKKSRYDRSLSGYRKNVKSEMRRLLATNFSGTKSVYGNVDSKEVIQILVTKGLSKQNAARMNNTMGFRAYKRKDWDNALNWFDNAIKYDSQHVLAIYNAACTWGLKRNAPKAVEYLEKLTKINKKAARKRIAKAKKDSDFSPVRNSQIFKDFIKKYN